MSKRNSREAKAARRLRRSITTGTHEGQMDLIAWVKQRSRVTSGMAERIILSGALRVDSHPIGVRQFGDRKFLNRYVPASLNTKIQIVMPKELQDEADD